MTAKAEALSLIRLLNRSTGNGDGWWTISRTMEDTVVRLSNGAPELFEVRHRDKMMIRLTERGRIVAEYV